MLFSIIYEFDCPREVSVKRYIPPKRDLWTQTEGDEQYEYGYLEGRWEKGKHRKFAAILTKEQFCEFVDHLYLYSEETETMGSLGAHPASASDGRGQSRSAAMTTAQSKAPTSPRCRPEIAARPRSGRKAAPNGTGTVSASPWSQHSAPARALGSRASTSSANRSPAHALWQLLRGLAALKHSRFRKETLMPKITTLGDLRPDYGQGLPTDWASAWIRTSPLLIAVVVLALACLGFFL